MARVALDGETMRFEEHSEAMGRWFDVFAAPVEPRGRFALVFKDVTERRAAEQALEESRSAERRSRRRAELLARGLGGLAEANGLVGRHAAENSGAARGRATDMATLLSGQLGNGGRASCRRRTARTDRGGDHRVGSSRW